MGAIHGRVEAGLFKPLQDGGDDLFLEFQVLWRDGQPSRLMANFIALMLKLAAREKLDAKQGKQAVRSPG